jgi:hypothetical protein
VVELGKLGMDTLILSEAPVNLGRACHCISATLASLAAHEVCAGFIMDAPNGSIVRSILALIEVGAGPRAPARAESLLWHVAATNMHRTTRR